MPTRPTYQRPYARARLRRALAAASQSRHVAPPRTPLQEFYTSSGEPAAEIAGDAEAEAEADADAQELTLADLERSLNDTAYDYRTYAVSNDDDNIGHWSAPELTTTSSLLLDADETEETEGQLEAGGAVPPSMLPSPAGVTDPDDRARQLRAVLFRSLAVPALTRPSSSQPPPLHHRHSLRRAIARSHRDLVRDRDGEFRQMVDVARTRVVDERGDEVEREASQTVETQGEEQTQLAHIVLPPSSSMTSPPIAADAPASAQGSSSSSSPSRNDDQEAERDRSKSRADAAVAGTAILPLARKDIKRAQAA
jgi:hypothetical protein